MYLGNSATRVLYLAQQRLCHQLPNPGIPINFGSEDLRYKYLELARIDVSEYLDRKTSLSFLSDCSVLLSSGLRYFHILIILICRKTYILFIFSAIVHFFRVSIFTIKGLRILLYPGSYFSFNDTRRKREDTNPATGKLSISQ